jgi:predicted nucleic acid-binding protein
MSDERSGRGDMAFVDTNVLVHSYDADAGDKHVAARSLIAELWRSRAGCLSAQVLQEFYVTVTRRVPRPLARPAAREVIETYAAWPVHRPEVDDVLAASKLEERLKMSFWDALVVVSAQRLGARTLFSEDLQSGRRIGELEVVNPFSG